MRILLLTIGSYGDVHPFVGLAQRLRQRGHDASVATNPFFRRLVDAAGVPFHPLGTRDQYERWTANADIWHPRKGGPAILGGVAEALRHVYGAVAKFSDPEGVVAGSSLAVGALTACEHLGRRYATVHLAPICIRSHQQMPRLPGGPSLHWMPAWMRRKFWEGADKWFIDPPIIPPLNRMRHDLGLEPVERLMNAHWHAPMLTVGMWPGWFAPPAPDWPTQVQLAGFPMYDESDVTPLDDELRRWLDAGEKPIAFTPGSAMRFGLRFFSAAAEACRRLGRRGVLLTRHPEQIPPHLPEGVRHVAFAPFGQLLPRCAALVHHGGIGSTAQALRAGIPQLIMAMSHDQPDNGERIRRLHCGDWTTPRAFTARRVARQLRHLLGDPRVAEGCRSAARQFDHADGLGVACDLLERLAQQPAPPARGTHPAAFEPAHA
jgi:UDP:flavonoid glycosyltransferase YjiC (YdhE family)